MAEDFEVKEFEGGEVVGIVSVFSGLAEAERILTDLEIFRSLANQLEAIFESSYDGIYVTDGKAKTLRVNKAYERISGIDRNNLLGVYMQELVEAGQGPSSQRLPLA